MIAWILRWGDGYDKGAFRLLADDPVPAMRKLTLALISEHMPERIAGLFPGVLFDRSTSVRTFARFVIAVHQLPLVPRALYVQGLAGILPRRIDAAVEGVGETGTRADADLVAPFLRSAAPRVRRAALRALDEITGAANAEEVRDAVFAQFCIGK